jgi:carboxyl-terminal processing protease
VQTNYVEELSEEELTHHAIEGLMQGLDDYSVFLNANDFEALQSNTTGKFGGIGIELGLVDGYFTVISPMDDTPADSAGIEAGDRITRLDDEPVKGWLLTDLIDRLRGTPGSSLSLTVQRESQSEPLTFALERAVITVGSVTSRELEPGYGYLRISQFQTSTGQDVESAVNKLIDVAGDNLYGLVLDLRNNPGGTLQASVDVADRFLQHGLIVYTEGRQRSSHAKYRATRGDLLAGRPIVVLINQGSASAAEIVAGALQDHGRATLMGTTSYGKGSVQSVLPLSDNQALKLTTAYYFTPAGRSIHEKGIDPDVELNDNDDGALLARAVEHLKSTSLHARL